MTRRTLAAPLTWTPSLLHQHLQGAMDLELWTIPYYLTVLYSIKDISCAPYRLIQSAVYQEMLHAQLVSNIANAYGYSPVLTAPIYQGKAVPHLDFDLDTPNPTEVFTPYSAELGALDPSRINTMCLIEYPEWDTSRNPDLQADIDRYGSIAEFYDAVRYGMYQLRHETRGGINQVEEFRYFFNALPDQTVSLDGAAGYRQAIGLIDVITDQGEGQSQSDTPVAPEHRNTADGLHESWSHYTKFTRIRTEGSFPAVYPAVSDPPPGSAGAAAQARLTRDFARYQQTLESLFAGRPTPDFGATMAQVGGSILTCWQRGAVPRFA
jgi:hypothetical protein